QGCNDLFIKNFAAYDYIVCPSGSCTLHIKDHLHGSHGQEAVDPAIGIRKKIYELVEFLTEILKVENIEASFPHKVGLHQSCHGQRGLKLAQMSELMAPPFSKPEKLLKMVKGIQLIDLDRKDECCGFGGTFCV